MKKIYYKSEDEWLEIRRKGIGGSDAPAICGVSPFGNPISVWLEKTGRFTPQPTNIERMEIGKEIEDFIARLFQKKTNKKVRRVNAVLIDGTYDFMLANIDRDIVNENAILEVKNTNSYKIKDIINEPSEHWVVQCQHYLGITGSEKAYLAVLAGNEKFIIHEINRDDELIHMIREKEKEFWGYVTTNTMPEIDINNINADILDVLYKVEPNKKTELPFEEKLTIEKYLELRKRIKELQDEQENLKLLLCQKMGDNEIAVCDKYIITQKEIKRAGYYVKEKTYRDFRIKEIIGG